jgi:hypothetical protein
MRTPPGAMPTPRVQLGGTHFCDRYVRVVGSRGTPLPPPPPPPSPPPLAPHAQAGLKALANLARPHANKMPLCVCSDLVTGCLQGPHAGAAEVQEPALLALANLSVHAANKALLVEAVPHVQVRAQRVPPPGCLCRVRRVRRARIAGRVGSGPGVRPLRRAPCPPPRARCVRSPYNDPLRVHFVGTRMHAHSRRARVDGPPSPPPACRCMLGTLPTPSTSELPFSAPPHTSSARAALRDRRNASTQRETNLPLRTPPL